MRKGPDPDLSDRRKVRGGGVRRRERGRGSDGGEVEVLKEGEMKER